MSKLGTYLDGDGIERESITGLRTDSMKNKQPELEVVDIVEKSLKSFGFISAERKCYTPKYGDGAYTIETWDAKKVKRMSEDKIDKLIAALVAFRVSNNLNTSFTAEEYVAALLAVVKRFTR